MAELGRPVRRGEDALDHVREFGRRIPAAPAAADKENLPNKNIKAD